MMWMFLLSTGLCFTFTPISQVVFHSMSLDSPRYHIPIPTFYYCPFSVHGYTTSVYPYLLTRPYISVLYDSFHLPIITWSFQHIYESCHSKRVHFTIFSLDGSSCHFQTSVVGKILLLTDFYTSWMTILPFRSPLSSHIYYFFPHSFLSALSPFTIFVPLLLSHTTVY